MKQEQVPDDPLKYVGLEYPEVGPRVIYENIPGIWIPATRASYVMQRKFRTLTGAQRWVSEFVPTPRPPPTDRNRPGRDPVPPVPNVFREPPERRQPVNPLPPIRRNRDVTSRQQGVTRGERGSSRQQRGQVRVESVVHDLSTSPGEVFNDDDDDSHEEYYQPDRNPPRPRPPPKPKSNVRNWYGLERRSDLERSITNRLRIVRELKQGGYELKEVFATKEEALD